jgi:hypothetical protein
VRPLQTLEPQAHREAGPAIPSADQLKQKRQAILRLMNHRDPEIAASAKRALLFVDIATAKTAAERHALIQRLSVTMTTQPSSDGRAGVIKSFAVHGKTRLRWFVPAVPAAPAGEPLSGPADAEAPGLWCEGETEYDPCASEQEMNDYMAFLAASQADAEAAQSAYEASSWDLEAGAMEIVSGPSACERDCESEAYWAGAGVTSALFTTVGASSYAGGVIAAGGALTIGAIAAGVALVGFTVGFAWYAVSAYNACRRELPRLLGDEFELRPLSEPAY